MFLVGGSSEDKPEPKPVAGGVLPKPLVLAMGCAWNELSVGTLDVVDMPAGKVVAEGGVVGAFVALPAIFSCVLPNAAIPSTAPIAR